MPVKLNAAAPAFKGVDQNNEVIASKDLKGQWYSSLTKLGVKVIGVSPDSIKSHQKFINDHDLNFSLISDEDKSICEKYGVWVQKSMYGRSYMGVERSTFIIDPDGKIKQIYAKVKVPGHVEEVTNWLKDNIKA